MIDAPEVCVGAIVRAGDCILMIERSHDPGVGRWSVPGGRVEAGETLSEALAREVREETGLDVEAGDLVGVVERIGPGYHFVILDFYASTSAYDGELPTPVAGDDASAARWVELTELDALPLVDGLADFLRTHGVIT